MRWYRHLTTAHSDPKLEQLLDTLGPQAYGAYWLINEVIAANHTTDNPIFTVRRSLKRWSSLCRVRAPFMHKTFMLLEELDLLEIEADPPYIDVTNNKLSKYLDDYTSKVRTKYSTRSRHSPDSVAGEVKRSEVKIKPPYPPSALAPSGGAPASGGNGHEEETYPPDTPEQTAEGKRKIQAMVEQLAGKQAPPPRTPRGEKF